MKLKFLGGCNEVGRSAILVDEKIVLDYGLRPSDPPEVPLTNGGGTFSPESVVISHAHLDHSGMVPSLMASAVRAGTGAGKGERRKRRSRSGKAGSGSGRGSGVSGVSGRAGPEVFMTSVTSDLAQLLSRDTIKVGKDQGFSLFGEEEVKWLGEKTQTLAYGERVALNGSGDYDLELHNAGHIPGSSGIHLKKEAKDEEISLFYTGDTKTGPSRLMKSASPDDFPAADILLIESTYYGKDHRDRRELEKEFVDSVKETLNAGGTAIVPCFAVGRTQEIVMILHSHGLTPFVDGMGLAVFGLFKNHPSFLKNAKALNAAFGDSEFVNSRKRKKSLAKPSVIVTTAGMLNGGPVLYYLKRTYDDPKSKILLTGYQIEGTNGRRLVEESCVDADGEVLKVRSQVEQYDFSAHAGDSELKELVSRFCRNGTEVVFMVHGERTEEFAAWARENCGCEAVAPKLGEDFEIV